MSRRLVVAAGMALAATVAGYVIVSALAPESKADKFIEYLDERGVTYSSRDAILRVADDICELSTTSDFNTEEYLRTVFSSYDASTITYGIENGGYCE